MQISQLFFGPNAGYALELLEQYEADPSSFDEKTKVLLEQLRSNLYQSSTNGYHPTLSTASQHEAPAPSNGSAMTVAAIVELASAIRNYGHRAADIDPLKRARPGDPLLDIANHALTAELLAAQKSAVIGGPIAEKTPSAREAVEQLRQVYTGTIGYDFGHVHDPKAREWLRASAESRRFHPDNTPTDRVALLQRLTAVEGFEQFLHDTFQGKKRFSIEGLDVMVLILDEILLDAARQSIAHVLVGMAHRGRLNVLTHVMQKPYGEMLAEFKDIYASQDDGNYTGDVKYHFGFQREIVAPDGEGTVIVEMADNPSHLELVNPVVEGMARAAGSKTGQAGQVQMDPFAVMPILIHGDAAFAGQGIVPETLNMSHLPGWRVGGTIHIIANNQVGFTTDKHEARSTLYASDIAKGFEIPIIHVNADDIDACIEVARLTMAYQTLFERDILIDLVGYRRYGHNEGDEPRFTQPLMYQAIDQHKTARALYADQLVGQGLLSAEDAAQMVTDNTAMLRDIYEGLDLTPQEPAKFTRDTHTFRNWDTQVDAETLRSYNSELLDLPKEFTTHRGIKRVLGRRVKALDEIDTPAIDWGQAESLAFASILADGTPIRITGEDVERGTFSHRHAALRDLETGKHHIALQQLSAAKATFEVRNSALSENAAVGFEYGYSLQKPESMVLWEGQFGDFVNGAQPIIDEYITSGRAKWGHKAAPILLLPHGYEGQGPDHSTARLERFLMMAADRNMRIVYPTTAAQYFHLLRRHMRHLSADPRPLIVMSPKSLLRHPAARSSLRELSEGTFQPIIDDPTVSPQRRRFIKRLVLCSGKVYVEAMESGYRPEKPSVAFVRVEQLYRFPLSEVKALIANYKGLQEVVWLQEEPQNGGAWSYVRPLLEQACGDLPLKYIGRPNRASPAEGTLHWHRIHQNEIMKDAYTLE